MDEVATLFRQLAAVAERRGFQEFGECERARAHGRPFDAVDELAHFFQAHAVGLAEPQIEDAALGRPAALDDVAHAFVLDGVVKAPAERHDAVNHGLHLDHRAIALLGGDEIVESHLQVRECTRADGLAQHHAVAEHPVGCRVDGVGIRLVEREARDEVLVARVDVRHSQPLADFAVVHRLAVDELVIIFHEEAQRRVDAFGIASHPVKTINLA